ncbi:hypothetical protein ACFE04_005062 [Oxalis oulophora]
MIRWRTDEDKEEELKREPARSEIYVKTRVRVDGTFSSRASETIVANINRITTTETASEGESSQDVLAKALEKPEKIGREIYIGMLPPSNGNFLFSFSPPTTSTPPPPPPTTSTTPPPPPPPPQQEQDLYDPIPLPLNSKEFYKHEPQILAVGASIAGCIIGYQFAIKCVKKSNNAPMPMVGVVVVK